jgi:LPS-assembly lipoprotein
MRQWRVILLSLCCVLAGCGYHLRGSAKLPTWLTDLTVVYDSNDLELKRLLVAQLESYHITLHANSRHSKYILVIENSLFNQQIISIGASTNTRQYLLTLTVTFKLLDKASKNNNPIERQITITRPLATNNANILSSNDEDSILRTEMRHDAATQIINTMNFIK